MKDLTRTPRSLIIARLRQIFLRSRERATALKQQAYTCQRCSVKQSKAKGQEVKVQVHHKKGILNWDLLVEEIRKYLLTSPEDLEVLCVECHKQETYK